MLNDATVDLYLKRIGAEHPETADLDALRELQERHILSVPFENLDYHDGTPIQLDESVVDKIVHRGRGGGCYELNPAFGFLLQVLGYQVEILPARTYSGEKLGPPMVHLALRVTLDGESLLVDVGFGKCPRGPLVFGTSGEQSDAHGAYELVPVGNGEVDVLLKGKPQYRIDDRPAELDAFLPTLWWYRTAPDSPFLQYVFASQVTASGRVSIRENTLTVTENGQRRTEELTTDDAVVAAYRTHLGIDVERAPKTTASYAGEEVDMYLN
ncbi:arylamine N-acetyltransferase family protein [Streptomyces luteolus]|uniref:Arylamine N-acetyltransferase n=1 Tax=Streptomyces luteolus TaxID=3043615 RepID=A0ABT6T7S0_9ACTN|nr:arylamine N-acetyltransferase [Streptomyces sp. B-S-A12]MDI3423943.1 arylamine N-acetyltransferase [Streptomyces sp. B-S-A12]